jgi:hypothetical protein
MRNSGCVPESFANCGGHETGLVRFRLTQRFYTWYKIIRCKEPHLSSFYQYTIVCKGNVVCLYVCVCVALKLCVREPHTVCVLLSTHFLHFSEHRHSHFLYSYKDNTKLNTKNVLCSSDATKNRCIQAEYQAVFCMLLITTRICCVHKTVGLLRYFQGWHTGLPLTKFC